MMNLFYNNEFIIIFMMNLYSNELIIMDKLYKTPSVEKKKKFLIII